MKRTTRKDLEKLLDEIENLLSLSGNPSKLFELTAQTMGDGRGYRVEIDGRTPFGPRRVAKDLRLVLEGAADALALKAAPMI